MHRNGLQGEELSSEAAAAVSLAVAHPSDSHGQITSRIFSLKGHAHNITGLKVFERVIPLDELSVDVGNLGLEEQAMPREVPDGSAEHLAA